MKQANRLFILAFSAFAVRLMSVAYLGSQFQF